MDARALRKNLVELLEGAQAHVTTRAALEGLTPALRGARPGKAGLHSVYEELEHMRLAQEDILRYTLDAGWKSPEWPGGYWPADNDRLTARTWKRTVTGFFADLDELIALVKNPRRDLTAAIPHGEGRTYLREVLLVADHNAYHLGQIVETRKLLGDWGR
jgi:uncharacterized damage-inducible protein DinB